MKFHIYLMSRSLSFAFTEVRAIKLVGELDTSSPEGAILMAKAMYPQHALNLAVGPV